ncbi:MAG: Glutamate N-acetyltransferase [Candidatus Methanofastidiosum methylothiophilum]|uniref:Arginine biosynthesis bifunctional protein ArgJ n=1 Tax=Candidatus Methanofastidiosum methylothiophilum TaxID=1705564 RepID=A0A150J187_9EURY|nr:MAG: Glutamate N-acetyltransferase [Candidatus Methanofastidiosum methylthiophilus]KYC48190.1 MAG: Glutamate N-acetyltransferase [Candidatus Methanofastidiosum methylthiophilus]KYC50845.1 MAG: Glutamate N-acetyltransferase [Candidatus Methanofastidiosum methylthiophilus]
MKIINGGITKVKGIKGQGVHAGFKKEKLDFTIIYSERVCNAAGVFTKNKAAAAPVIIDREFLSDGKAQAIVCNSGFANACTGNEGIKDALFTAEYTSEKLGIKKENCLIFSTGVIGIPIPMKIMESAIDKTVPLLDTSDEASENIANAILTTDLVKKEVTIENDGYIISGITKGSGMIHPNMATMLCFIFTDADIPSNILKDALKVSVNKSFNRISVDGDTSTNDSVVILANGLSNVKIDTIEKHKSFCEALDFVCIELAKKIARDGEGATKLIECECIGAKSQDDADCISKSIISSSLVKSAIFGEDPNWGRIVAAAGYSGAEMELDKIEVYLGDLRIVNKGKSAGIPKEESRKELQKDYVKIKIIMNLGEYSSKSWGCDLSYDYVKINAQYHT